MVELKRTLKCANCGKENTFYLSSDMTLNEIVAYGKCSCGSSLQLNFNIVEPSSTNSSSNTNIDQALPNAPIDDTMMEPEFPSDAIRDLIDG